MDTLLLDPVSWDLVLDSNGNIAKATRPYAIAQDVASEIKLFSGELYYNTAKGLPYFEQILAVSGPSAATIMAAQAEAAALNVPGVTASKCTALYFDSNTRKLSGTLLVADSASLTHSIQF